MSSAEREHPRPAPVLEAGAAKKKKKPHERLPDLITLAHQQTNPEEQRRFTVDGCVERARRGSAAEWRSQ